jgi:hypothetical protein
MDKLVTALAPVFAVGFAVQQLLEILGSFLDTWELFKEYKKVILGMISLSIGIVFAFSIDGLRVLQPLFTDPATAKPTANIPQLLDQIATALVISAGTEGVNSILKFLKYAKEDKKTEVAKKLDPAVKGGVPGTPGMATANALAALERK